MRIGTRLEIFTKEDAEGDVIDLLDQLMTVSSTIYTCPHWCPSMFYRLNQIGPKALMLGLPSILNFGI
jgi:hypothetical protein